jgi:hypothetical protein
MSGAQSSTITITSPGAATKNISVSGTGIQPPTVFSITGHVRSSNENGIGGVVMGGLPGDPTTDSNGYYAGTVDNGWSGTIIPTKEGHTFTPPSTTYNNVTQNEVTDYTGAAHVTISEQPTDQTVTEGSTATFSVSVNGTAPFSYFWYKNGDFITNTTNTSSTTSTYTTPTLNTSDNKNRYYCLITNCNNLFEAQTSVAVLTVETKVGVREYSDRIPKTYSLFQNYPNPFNPISSIKYALPSESRVLLTIYNMLGQRIATLVDGRQSAGFKSVNWNAGGVASGLYIYRIEATSVSDPSKTFVQVRKMALIR